MKNFLILVSLTGFLLSSCKSSQMAYNADDAYASPAEEKQKLLQAKAEQAKLEEAEKKRVEDERLAQKAKDDANPYYKDPDYKADDYYDYEYAARINRFYNPIGVGYYDSYYTNAYTYNQNPNMYGTSIYSTYNYGMPSSQFSNVSFGISSGWGYGNSSIYNGYNMGYGYNNFGYYNDPWGYGSYYNNPWGYNPYTYGTMAYMNGYYNGYYNGFCNAGYYNMYDANSAYGNMTYAPRGSNNGGNGGERTTAGMQVDNGRQRYVESVQSQQSSNPRFSSAYESSARRGTNAGSETIYNNGGSNRISNGSGSRIENRQNNTSNENSSVRQDRVRNSTGTNKQEDNRSQNRNANEHNNSGGLNNSNNSGGGSSSPRNGGGNSGGGGRRR